MSLNSFCKLCTNVIRVQTDLCPLLLSLCLVSWNIMALKYISQILLYLLRATWVLCLRLSSIFVSSTKQTTTGRSTSVPTSGPRRPAQPHAGPKRAPAQAASNRAGNLSSCINIYAFADHIARLLEQRQGPISPSTKSKAL